MRACVRAVYTVRGKMFAINNFREIREWSTFANIIIRELLCSHIHGIIIYLCMYYTVWPEILAGRYFGGLLKICHLAEFTLAVEPVLAIMIFIAKWLIERAGNLTLP